MLGLETALAVAYGAMCLSLSADAGEARRRLGAGRRGRPAMSLRELLGLFSWKPARIAGLGPRRAETAGGRPRRPGRPHRGRGRSRTSWCSTRAPSGSSTRAHQASRSRNTPYAGRRLTGKVRHTVFAGEAVVVDGEAQR